MSWAPNDLVSDVDLLAYESNVLTQFRQTDWETKRLKALEDWLAPILRTQGFAIERLRTRYEADKVWGFTGAAYTDLTSAALSTTADDVNLAAVFATVGTDALYVGSTAPFRGLSLRLLEAVGTAAAAVSVAFWGDGWTALSVTDGTLKTAGKSFSGGGALTWRVPSTWVRRTLNSSASLYWAKVTISATPTAAKAAQIGVIRRSALCAPAALRTLALIMREAPTGGDGPWADKAEYYQAEADLALQRALQIVGGEFETDDPATDIINPDEADNTVEEAGGGWRMERA